MDVIVSPIVNIFHIISFAIGITGVTFIALILFLDRRLTPEPIALPPKKAHIKLI